MTSEITQFPRFQFLFQDLLRIYQSKNQDEQEQISKILPQYVQERIFKLPERSSGNHSRTFHIFNPPLTKAQQAIRQFSLDIFSSLETKKKDLLFQNIQAANLNTPLILDELNKVAIELYLEKWENESKGTEDRKSAATRIREFLSSFETYLDLTSFQLKTLPDVFSHKAFMRLQMLNLSKNQLTQLPVDLEKLIGLEKLDLSENAMTKLPPTVCELVTLRGLYLFDNQLTELPTGFAKLVALENLVLSKNQFTTVPPEVYELVKLEELALAENGLRELPSEIGKLTSLRRLFLTENELRELPPEISKLTSLEELYLAKNQLKSLPEELIHLPIEKLNLADNEHLTDISSVILNLSFGMRCIIEVGGIPKSSLEPLRAVIKTRGYLGPRIFFREQALEEESTQQWLDKLVKTAHPSASDFSFSLEGNSSQLDDLKNWVNHLFSKPDYQQDGQRSQLLAQSILSYLELARRNPQFKALLFRIINETELLSENRAALSILYIELAYERETVDLKSIQKIAGLVYTSWSLDQLETAPYTISNSSEDQSNVFTIYLNLLIKLKERLGLNIDIEMIPSFTCRKISKEDAEKIATWIEEQLNPEDYYKILISDEKWKEVLEVAYPNQMEKLKASRNSPLIAVQATYRKQLIELSKKVLPLP